MLTYRMPIIDVLAEEEGDRISVFGTVGSRSVRVGDFLVVMPSMVGSKYLNSHFIYNFDSL